MAKTQEVTDTSPSGPRAGSSMSRYISFVMLVVTILVCGFYFYNVIKGFLLPLFLAVLLAVIFRPFHQFVDTKCRNRPTLAAAISTAAIMLIVLVPLAGLVGLGLYEANQVIRDRQAYLSRIEKLRRDFGFQKPFAMSLDTIETELRKLDETLNRDFKVNDANGPLNDSAAAIQQAVLDLEGEVREAARKMWSEKIRQANPLWTFGNDYMKARRELESKSNDQASLDAAIGELQAQMIADSKIASDECERAFVLNDLIFELERRIGPGPTGSKFKSDGRTPEMRSLNYLIKRSQSKPELGFLPLVDAFQKSVAVLVADQSNQALTDVQVEYDELRTGLLGGPLWKWAVEILNPSSQQIGEWLGKAFAGGATRWLPSITNTATSLLTGLLVGLGIMSVALFYFFMDGPKMISTFMQLSPLDDRHELELLEEFDKVSRAVVLATLLSAVAQGILGGIGYKIVGLESVFLLTLLTAVLSLIPFVGAAAIWVPCCVYIAFIQEVADPGNARTWLYAKAAFLAVYGIVVISMADNVIKPWVLQGQSKLHPLLALLSVLGGVQALGPIGILVGPMVVAFLQVLLTILQSEITSLDEELKSTGAS